MDTPQIRADKDPRISSDFSIIDAAIRRVVKEAVDAERRRKYNLLGKCVDWSTGKNFRRAALTKSLENLLQNEKDKDIRDNC